MTVADADMDKMVEQLKSASDVLLIDAKEASRLCCISSSTWYKLHSSGRVPVPIKLGRRTLWRKDELIKWVAAGCPPRHKWAYKP